MKKSDLKKILKPIVRECIQETLLKGGLLSSIISEVVKGIYPEQQIISSSQTSTVNEQIKAPEPEKNNLLKQKREADRQRRLKILNATGFSEVFKGVEPLSEGSPSQQGPLAGVDSGDPGVDISGIVALGGNHWKQLVK